jgi:hypothetical protein
MEPGMLLAPLLLLFGAITPSVTAGMVRLELSVAMTTSASETSRGLLTVDPNVLPVVALRKASLGTVGLYFDDDAGKGRHTEDSLTSANASVTRNTDKGTEVLGPSGDEHFSLVCLTLTILKPNS